MNEGYAARAWTLFVGAALCVIRVGITQGLEPEPLSWFGSYKAVAHLFVGGVFVGWWIQRQRWQLALFSVLCVVEVVCAVLARI